MKKTIICTLLCASLSASAATINWGATSLYYGTAKTTSTDTIGYLVYLGTATNYNNIDIAALVRDGEDYESVADTKTPGSTTTSKGKISGAADSASLLNSITPVDGSSYFGTIYVTTQDSKQYYLLGATQKYDTSSTSYDSVLETFSWQSDKVTSNASSAAQGWVAVPEPSTAALALAGLALLLKRRKA